LTDISNTLADSSLRSGNNVGNLDELYYLAQMLASNITDVNKLVEKAIKLRHEGSDLPNADLLRVARNSEMIVAGADLMKTRQLEVDLGYIVPRLLTKTAPDRRVNIVQAFGNSFADPVERSAFMHRIRRALETHSDPAFADLVTEGQVGKSIRIFIESTFSPTPSALRGMLESKYAPKKAAPGSIKNQKEPIKKGSLPFRIATGFILILIASAIGTWIAKPASVPDAPTGRIEILSQIDDLDPSDTLVFQGSDQAQIEQLISDRTNQRVQVPSLSQGEIRGLSLEALSENFTIPVVHYTLNGKNIPLYILDYRSIQGVFETLNFDSSVLNQIASPNGLDIHVLESKTRIVFRHRDDIFISFVDDNPMEFRSLFQFDQ